MKFKAKSIIKKVALVLACITAVTAVGFGAKAIYDRAKDDLKTITPVFEVGNLGADGKFVDDKSTLYTKSAFEAEGLQIKLDFDSQINYQIFYYDDLDNFVESTAVLSSAYYEPGHDGYARIVITPTDDEDGKISLLERVQYPGQMTIKVNKKQDVQYYNVFNKRLQVVENVSSLRFKIGAVGGVSTSDYHFNDNNLFAVTSADLLSVKGYSTVNINIPESYPLSKISLFELDIDNKGSVSVLNSVVMSSSVVLNNATDYVLFQFTTGDDTPISSSLLPIINSFITLSK